MTDLFDIESFRGDGSSNEQNLGLEEFLEQYDSNKFEKASNTVDTLVLAYNGIFKKPDASYRILMIRRRNHPSIGFWALPGGFVEMNESLEQAAKRELEEETGIKDLAVEQLHTWGDVNRDPRTRIITTSYLAVVEDGLLHAKAGDDAADAAWFTVSLSRENKKAPISENGKCVDSYVLKLNNMEKEVELYAKVDEEYRRNSVIKEKKYLIKESGHIAGDHGALIVQALLQLGIAEI